MSFGSSARSFRNRLVYSTVHMVLLQCLVVLEGIGFGETIAIYGVIHELKESIVFEKFFKIFKFSDRNLNGDRVLIFVEGLHSGEDDRIKVSTNSILF